MLNSMKKKYIIHEFQEMDVALLGILLNEELSYQNQPKAVFLEHLETLFDTFKNEGDTKLLLNPGHCKGCNKGCAGYQFIGNHSKLFTTFIFEETEHDYKDIYYCARFTPIKIIDNLNAKVYFDLEEETLPGDDESNLPF